jgi:hypothetical protein
MFENDSETQDCIEIADRTRRALEEYMTVLPEFGRAADAPGLFVVVGENENGEYLCDTRTGGCECKDAEYRDPEGGCKHVRRCRIVQGEKPVPAASLGDIEVDSSIGVHVDSSPKFTTADGGVIDAGDGAELIDDDGPEWTGPHTEYDRYGQTTGTEFVRCSKCGVEVLVGRQENATHADGCDGC